MASLYASWCRLQAFLRSFIVVDFGTDLSRNALQKTENKTLKTHTSLFVNYILIDWLFVVLRHFSNISAILWRLIIWNMLMGISFGVSPMTPVSWKKVLFYCNCSSPALQYLEVLNFCSLFSPDTVMPEDVQVYFYPDSPGKWIYTCLVWYEYDFPHIRKFSLCAFSRRVIISRIILFGSVHKSEILPNCIWLTGNQLTYFRSAGMELRSFPVTTYFAEISTAP